MKKLLLMVFACGILSACATPRTEVGTALFSQTKQPLLVTEATGTKTGRACAKNILGLYISGDMSIAAAKKAGRISKVTSVDKDIKSYAVYAEVCTVVTGY